MTGTQRTMRRLAKGRGVGNFALEDAPVPEPGPREVLIRVHRSLISRGSEIGGRYRNEEVVAADALGYSAAGDVVAAGNAVTGIHIGDRVAVMAPHAEYVIGDLDAITARAVTPIPDSVTYEQAVFHPLTVGAVMWSELARIQPEEAVVVMGQGLVGNLVLQACRAFQPAQIIAVDAIDTRCEQALAFGADTAIDARTEDPVERVRELTDGVGAHVVMECVGGPAGVHTFPQALSMTRPLGRVHLISLYHERPLALDSRAIQQRAVIGGYFVDLETAWRPAAGQAMEHLASGSIRVDPLVSHRFHPSDASDAYAMLHDRLEEAFGVVFAWVD